MSNDISDKDKKDWNKFIHNNEKLPDKDYKNFEKKRFITKSIDLHGFTLDEANKTIEKFVNKSFLENVSKLIIITGKGLHSDNEKNPFVSKFIKSNKNLMSKIREITEANIEDGGGGAFYIFLKKNKSTK